jgi:sec-independent protein translocase protein TatB
LFEGRFSEILIIFILALIVLGPEKLPRVVSEAGRWLGRARAMTRQFREQLEEEVEGEDSRKRAAAAASADSAPAAGERPPASAEPPTAPTDPAQSANPGDPADPVAPGDAVVRPPLFSHAHPSEAEGAEPPFPGAGRPPSADERTN